jgi:hypothetical protein
MNKLQLVISITIVSAMTFSGCAKDGATGPAGKNGNANVTSTNLVNPVWTWDGTSYYSYCTWSPSNLTSVVNSSGSVMVYGSDGSGGWYALPITLNTSTYQQHQYFDSNTNSVTIYIENSNLSNPNPSSTMQFKVVCIPPAAIKANPSVNIRDYNQVRNAFHLN